MPHWRGVDLAEDSTPAPGGSAGSRRVVAAVCQRAGEARHRAARGRAGGVFAFDAVDRVLSRHAVAIHVNDGAARRAMVAGAAPLRDSAGGGLPALRVAIPRRAAAKPVVAVLRNNPQTAEMSQELLSLLHPTVLLYWLLGMSLGIFIGAT